jgi:DNA binding domain, excisionase family
MEMFMETEQRYFSPQELSQYLGIAIQTVYEWTSQKKVPYIKLGRLVKFDQREIDNWMKTQRIEPYAN